MVKGIASKLKQVGISARFRGIVNSESIQVNLGFISTKAKIFWVVPRQNCLIFVRDSGAWKARKGMKIIGFFTQFIPYPT